MATAIHESNKQTIDKTALRPFQVSVPADGTDRNAQARQCHKVA